MKMSPQRQRLEELLNSSKIVVGGFKGTDQRDVETIIDEDVSVLSSADITLNRLADKMRSITDKAAKGLGTWVDIDQRSKAKTDEAKGSLICPWPHTGQYLKRNTVFYRKDLEEGVKWTDLGIHMIQEHGFFQGRGSNFRTEPAKLIRLLFDIQPEEPELQKFRCLVCGYIYDPRDNHRVKFHELSENWTCPTCGAIKDRFQVLEQSEDYNADH